MQKTLSIIIPTYNRKETLKKTLLSLCNQTSDDFEVIVADDGSTDGTGDLVTSYLDLPYPTQHVWQKNSGRSSARNMGVEKANGKYFLFIDDHIIADNDLVEEHIKAHEDYGSNKVRVIRGKVKFIKSPEEITKEAPLENERPLGFSEQDPFKIFHTNNISVEKEAFLSVGGFDEDFKEYGLQDSELGFRLKKAGFDFKYHGKALGYIFQVGLTIEQRCSRKRQIGHSSVLFFKKHPLLYIKLFLGTHLLNIGLYYLLYPFKVFFESNNSLLLFFNFLAGLKEGFRLYSKRKYDKFCSRFKQTKYNVLLVSHSGDLSGAPISLSLLAKYLDKNKFNVIFLSPKGPVLDSLKKEGIETVLIDWPRSLRTFFLIKRKKIDLVHANTFLSSFSAWAGKLAKVPVVWHIREDLGGNKFCLLRNKISFLADRIILISNWMKDFFNTKKAIVIHNGIDLENFYKKQGNLKSEFWLKKDTILIGTVGSIEARKGIHILIQAAQEIAKTINNFKIVIVGKPLPSSKKYLSYLKRLVGQLRVYDKVVFAGARADIQNVLSSLDLFVLPSLSEPFGRVALEAMASSVPVVASNVGGIPEIVENNHTGLLFEAGNSELLAEKIVYLLGSEEKRKNMGQAGRERAEKLFSMKQHAKNIEKVYFEVLEGK